MKLALTILAIIISVSANGQINIQTSGENQGIGDYQFDYQTNTFTFSPGLDSLNTIAVWFNFKMSGYRTDTVLTLVAQAAEYVHRTNFLAISCNNSEYTRTLGRRTDGAVVFTINPPADSLYIATGFPYDYSRNKELLNRYKGHKYLKDKVLTITESGLEVDLLTITGKGRNKNKQLIWIIGRQHAFECVASYVMEGMIEYLLSTQCDSKILKKFIFKIVPMVDVESVYHGQSGRMALPRDFNRDWDNPVRPAIRLIESEIAQSARKYKYSAFWDIHGTYPGGLLNYGFSYFDLYDNSGKASSLDSYWKKFELISGYAPYSIRDNSDSYNGTPADIWNEKNFPQIQYSTTLEIDWGLDANGKPWTIEGFKEIGANMIRAFK